MLSPYYYFEDGVFSREREEIFLGQWQLIGFRSEVLEDQSYFCREVGGKSVVVQNFSGMLRAFHNVCSHRFGRIRQPGTGCGPLRCPYHGWTYNIEGIPVGIPFPDKFKDCSAEDRLGLRLDAWDLEQCGELIFVRQRKGGDDLRTFLGKTYGFVRKVADALGSKLDTNAYEIGANWKIPVENTLESYHVNFVHPESFARLGTSGCNFAFDGWHSSWVSDVAAGISRNWARVEKYYQESPLKIDGYIHQLLFPNVTITSLFGSTFSIQQFLPKDPGRTLCVSHVFESRLGNANRDHPVVRSLSASSVQFIRTVLAEDCSICEDIQRAVSETPIAQGVLGAEEERIEKFQTAYLEALGDV